MKDTMKSGLGFRSKSQFTGMLQMIIMIIMIETQCADFAQGDHMVSLGDDVQDVVWTPQGRSQIVSSES